MWSMENCRDCKGTGSLGEYEGNKIICPNCEGGRKVFISRMSVWDGFYRKSVGDQNAV